MGDLTVTWQSLGNSTHTWTQLHIDVNNWPNFVYLYIYRELESKIEELESKVTKLEKTLLKILKENPLSADSAGKTSGREENKQQRRAS